MKKDKLIQMSVRQRMSPFPNYLSMEAVSTVIKKIVGTAYENIIIIFKENIMYVFVGKKDHEIMENQVFKRVLSNHNFFHEMVEVVNKKGVEFVEWIKKLLEKNVNNYTDEELAEFHKEYEQKYKIIYAHYFNIFIVEKKFGNYLKEHLKSKIENEKVMIDCFSTMITEPRAQVNGREELAALKLAKKITENEVWHNYFKQKNINKTIEIIKQDTTLNKLFTKHTNDYFWITRDYEDPVLTYNDFITRMSVILKKHPLKKLSEKEDYLKNLILKIKNIEQKLKIDDKHKELFKAMREGIHLKELRKTFVSQSLYYYDSILKEIARRGGITLKEARHIKTEEVIKLLKEKNMKEELSERVKLSVFLVKKGKTKILIGKKAALMYEDLCLAKGDINELKGFSAAPGFARGPVQIIMHPTEIDKIKKGVILVTAQIVPSFGPALKKIAGLVCDGGTGITSHPAILAREAGIPAVTSTNVATQVLKDGDLVEVDGYKGIVKKL